MGPRDRDPDGDDPDLTEVEAASLDISADGRYLAVIGMPLDGARANFLRHLIVVNLAGPNPVVQR